MKIYTKNGDKGTTSLCGGHCVAKDDLRVEAYGTIDELNAHLGLLISFLNQDRNLHFVLYCLPIRKQIKLCQLLRSVFRKWKTPLIPGQQRFHLKVLSYFQVVRFRQHNAMFAGLFVAVQKDGLSHYLIMFCYLPISYPL